MQDEQRAHNTSCRVALIHAQAQLQLQYILFLPQLGGLGLLMHVAAAAGESTHGLLRQQCACVCVHVYTSCLDVHAVPPCGSQYHIFFVPDLCHTVGGQSLIPIQGYGQ
jgi:hypothetical protein